MYRNDGATQAEAPERACHIASLPPELMYEIAQHLKDPAPDIQPSSSSDGGRPRKKRAMSTAASFISVLAFSHVCRAWRALAIALPELWTDVYVNPLHCYDAGAITDILSRSRDRPITLCFEYLDPSVVIEQWPLIKLRSPALYHFLRILVFVCEVIHRCRRIRILTNEENQEMMYNIFSHCPAPALEHLEIFCHPSQRPTDRERMGYYQRTWPLSFDPTVLRHVYLDGVIWMPLGPLLAVETLALVNTTPGHAMMHFFRSGMPALRRLTLSRTSVSWRAKLRCPVLEDLRVEGGESCSVFNADFGDAPSLTRVQISKVSDQQDWKDVMRGLGTHRHAQTGSFKNVTRLRIENCDLGQLSTLESMRTLSDVMPSLTHLDLRGCNAGPIASLLDTHADICPMLTMMVVDRAIVHLRQHTL